MLLTYLLRRLGVGVATLLVLIVLTFSLLRFAPGSPFDSDQNWPAEIQANILKKYHLDQPVYLQFQSWLRDLLHGDLGNSFQYIDHSVVEILREALPPSLILGSLALVLSILIGIPLGALSAVTRWRWLGGAISLFSLSGLALPPYLLGSVLIVLFSVWLGWLPPALWEGPSSILLPMIALSLRPAAILTRMTKTAVHSALGADYIRTARAKGLPEWRVVAKHALKNAMVPVIGLLGPMTANLITGSFIIEVIFQIPGMGRYFVQAVLNRDYPLALGVTLVYGVALILCNLWVDLSYGLIDPRIRLAAKGPS